jgi:hypothetical protein
MSVKANEALTALHVYAFTVPSGRLTSRWQRTARGVGRWATGLHCYSRKRNTFRFIFLIFSLPCLFFCAPQDFPSSISNSLPPALQSGEERVGLGAALSVDIRRGWGSVPPLSSSADLEWTWRLTTAHSYIKLRDVYVCKNVDYVYPWSCTFPVEFVFKSVTFIFLIQIYIAGN